MYGSLAECVVPGKSTRNDFPLLPSQCALLIIDIQDYLSKPTSEEEKKSYFFKEALPRSVKNIAKMLECFRAARDESPRGSEVIFTYLESLTKDCRDVSLDYKLSGPKLASLPNSSTSPAKFLPEVSPSVEGRGDIKIPKTSCSVFPSTNLHYVLRNLHIEQLVITGQLTDQCVESAVRDAADLGFFVTVVQDACSAMSLESHEKGLHGMKGFCRIVDTQDVIDELSKGYTVKDLPIPNKREV
jgi:ureidoacrylate peracid hydrolase